MHPYRGGERIHVSRKRQFCWREAEPQEVTEHGRWRRQRAYRRGGRSHVSRKRQFCWRKAEPQEVTEHGRWRRQRAGFGMPTQYLEWTLLDRLALTLFCM